MNPNYRILMWLQLLLLLPAGLAVKHKKVLSDPNLHVKRLVRTVNTNGYQRTEGGHVGRWLLHVMDGEHFACGASYYKPLYVLTSANCMHRYRKKLNTMSVEFVNPDMDVASKYAMIESVNVPKKYRYPDNYMDIAVIKLRQSLHDDSQQPFVQLCKNPLRTYETLTVVACGVDPTESFDRTSTEDIAVMHTTECQPQYARHKLRISETIACAREFNSGRYRMYEFGCPVTSGVDELCGIVAWGPQFHGAHPGLITDIYQVKPFIVKVVSGILGDSRGLLKRSRRMRSKRGRQLG
ncbi:seminase-like [Drosophila obscura]|uniref:seminase-like n=1 Tax=Drosophila obscura TaxID=7282 RepID=UPI001BB16B94|nr:seminase-like [Drosophila obscura]